MNSFLSLGRITWENHWNYCQIIISCFKHWQTVYHTIPQILILPISISQLYVLFMLPRLQNKHPISVSSNRAWLGSNQQPPGDKSTALAYHPTEVGSRSISHAWVTWTNEKVGEKTINKTKGFCVFRLFNEEFSQNHNDTEIHNKPFSVCRHGHERKMIYYGYWLWYYLWFRENPFLFFKLLLELSEKSGVRKTKEIEHPIYFRGYYYSENQNTHPTPCTGGTGPLVAALPFWNRIIMTVILCRWSYHQCPVSIQDGIVIYCN